MVSTLKVSLSVATTFAMPSSGAATRWNPPAIRRILELMVAAASTIFSIPGCEQPTTSTMPSEVLTASDNSLSSLVPGIGNKRDQRNAWDHFGGLVDKLEIGTLPSSTELHHLRRRAFVVPHLGGQRSV